METFDYADIERRLKILALPDRPIPPNQPPLTCYVDETTDRGPRVTATPEFDAWFDRTYVPSTKQDAEQRGRISQPDRVPGEQTKDRPGLSRFKAT